MTSRTIILVGGPDSGKTNFLGRFWKALRDGEGALLAPKAPKDIEYVEEVLEHLLKGTFAPRSEKSVETSTRSFAVPVVSPGHIDDEPTLIVVPDATGELWKKAVETSEMPVQWMERLNQADGAMIFLRVGSKQNVEPMDWVTCATLLRMQEAPAAEEASEIPTQVALCELLRFLEKGLSRRKDGSPPKVCVAITAWDLLHAETAALGPDAYLRAEYPLFAGRLEDTSELAVKVFGVSIVSGDFSDDKFQKRFFEKGLKKSGYVMVETDGDPKMQSDLTLPVAWVLED